MLEINGTLTTSDDTIQTIIINIDGNMYEAIVDSNGEFEIDIPQELFAQDLTKLNIFVICMVLLAIFGYSFYEIGCFVSEFHFGYKYHT
jgi:hypothetical protein